MKYSKEFKIGTFAVIVLVVSFFIINYLRGVDIFNNEIELVSRYDDVAGLVPSAPVYVKGFKAGKVAEVTYDSQSEDFKVVCSILKDFRIPEDSRMTIYSVDIMGGKGIRIDLGTSETAAVNGSVLSADMSPDLIGELTGSIGPLLSKVSGTLDSLVVTVSSVNGLLCEENRRSISATLAKLESLMSDAAAISGTIEGRSEDLEVFISNLSVLSEKLNSLAESADSTLAGIDTVLESIDDADIRGVVSSSKQLLDNINDPDGSVGKLFVDDSIYNSVDSLLNEVGVLVSKIQENPKKYLRISVF